MWKDRKKKEGREAGRREEVRGQERREGKGKQNIGKKEGK